MTKRLLPPFERQRAQLPADLEDAARQVLKDFLLAHSNPQIGALPPPAQRGKRDPYAAIRDARATVELIRAQLGPEVIRDIEWFVACVVNRADGSPMRFQDAGAEIAPGKNAEAQRWAGYGALYRSLCVLQKFYSRQRALGKTGSPSTPTDKEALNDILTRLAETRKLRQSH